MPGHLGRELTRGTSPLGPTVEVDRANRPETGQSCGGSCPHSAILRRFFPEPGEVEIRQRPQRYADESTQGSDSDPESAAGSRSVRRKPSSLALGLAVVALGTVVGLFAASSLGRPVGTGVSAVLSPSAGVPQTSPTPALTSVSSATATATAAVTAPPRITGLAPPPTATPPPGTTFIGGLTLASLLSATTELGLPCKSSAGTGGDSQAGYNYFCEGLSADGRARLTVSGSYWTPDAIVVVHLTVMPEPLTASLGSASSQKPAASRLLSIPYQGSNAAAARQWLDARIVDAGCTNAPCERTIGSARLSVQLGERGSFAVSIDGLTAAR